MKSYRIPLEATGQFSRLFLNYINQDKTLAPFYKYAPVSDSFDRVIKDVAPLRFNRKLLVEVISEQYSNAHCPLPTAQCQLLLEETTFTVCTGHQLCLFTGPLYFIYKIITTINLAEQLKKKYPASNFVPVYWMASEDHDFEEVNHINLFGKRIEWNNKQGGAVGQYLNEGIEKLIEELKPVLGDSTHAKKLIELLQNAYTRHSTISLAMRFLVDKLFGHYGLVIVEPNEVRFKKEFIEVMDDDLFHNSAFKEVEKSMDELGKFGYKSQVNPREINLFYITDNQRNRIVKDIHKFNIVDSDKSFTETGLKEELKLHPERFSPNVVMRPLYQQKLLPNLAYVGGPGEIAYWLEYRKIFDHYKIPFPVLMPRNFVMLLDTPVLEKSRKLELAFEDLFLPVKEMTEKFIKSISGEKISLEHEKKGIANVYTDISEKAARVDATLANSVKAGLQKNLEEIENLEKKMLRAFKQRNETAVGQIEKIKQKLFPGGELQERYDNFIPFYLKYGKNFIEELKKNLDPFDFSFNILSEKE